MPHTPNYAIPYQAMSDRPHGPDLGENGFLRTDAVIKGVDTRVATLESQILLLLTPHSAIAVRNTALEIPHGTPTDVTLPNQESDNANMFTPGDAHITIGVTAWYDIRAWVLWEVGGTGWRRLAISKNNGTTTGTDSWHDLIGTPGATSDCGQHLGLQLPLSAGDTIRMKAWHTQGVGLDVTNARLSVTMRRTA